VVLGLVSGCKTNCAKYGSWRHSGKWGWSKQQGQDGVLVQSGPGSDIIWNFIITFWS
jgi:hypothetical protein